MRFVFCRFVAFSGAIALFSGCADVQHSSPQPIEATHDLARLAFAEQLFKTLSNTSVKKHRNINLGTGGDFTLKELSCYKELQEVFEKAKHGKSLYFVYNVNLKPRRFIWNPEGSRLDPLPEKQLCFGDVSLQIDPPPFEPNDIPQKRVSRHRGAFVYVNTILFRVMLGRSMIEYCGPAHQR